MSTTSTTGVDGNYSPEKLAQMKVAFEICATLDHASFPLAATLLAEHDDTTSGTEENKDSDGDDDNEESRDRLTELQSKIAALGIDATSTFKVTAGNKYTAEDLEGFEEHTKAILKASKERFVSECDTGARPHRESTEADCIEGEGEIGVAGRQESLRIKRASKKPSLPTPQSASNAVDGVKDAHA